MNTLKYALYIFIFVITVSGAVSASGGKMKIVGYVRNSDTLEPISFVNVFLAGTTRGTTTDEDGYYEIRFVAPGNYDMIASMMGFEMSQINLRVTDERIVKIDFKLKPIVLEAPELEVSADIPRAWRVDLKLFNELFLGTTSNASKCEIMNPEVLSFHRTEGDFIASASQPLIIENRALGMELTYILKDFTYMSDLKIKYRGISKFTHMEPKNSKQLKKWEDNRRSTYYGSVHHFLYALVRDRLRDEGFLVHHKRDVPHSISDRMDFIRGVEVDSLLSPAGIPQEKLLEFNDFLQVYDSRRNVTSWIQLAYSPVLINTMGFIYDPYALRTFGYWSTLGIAELLPKDYLP